MLRINDWLKRSRYQFRKAIYRSRAHIGWMVIALICLSLWFVDNENQRLSTENLELRARYTEAHNRLVDANRANEAALERYTSLREGQEEIINLLLGGDCANQR